MAGIDKTQVQFQRALELLRDPDAGITAEMIYSLSDLAGDNLKAFRALWPTLPADRRRSLITRLVETGETNFEFDFGAVVRIALEDADAQVRATAIEGVIEDSSTAVIERLMALAQEDSAAEVRAAAAGSLGQFILLGELGKLPEPLNTRLQDTALALYHNPNEDLHVRRRALEAISNCGREEVLEMIREAYYADALPMRVSAVFAMGRSCDAVWAPQIMEELSSENAPLRYEAVRAAGELELRRALPRLAELAYDEDREIQEMAIWSLGEIGGKQARSVLGQLAALAVEAEDDDLIEAIEEAQAAAQLSDEDVFPLFDFTDIDGLDDELDEDEAIELAKDKERFARANGFFDDLEDVDDLDDEDEDKFDLDDLDDDERAAFGGLFHARGIYDAEGGDLDDLEESDELDELDDLDNRDTF